MSRYLTYCLDQAELLPPSVRDVLGQNIFVFSFMKWWNGLICAVFIRAMEKKAGSFIIPP